MSSIANDLRKTVEEAAHRLRDLSDEESVRRPAPDKWSPREIVGHLIDSAANNHRRFVEAQLRDDLVFPGYEQDEWVATQRYAEAPWESLVELWFRLNEHVAWVIEGVSEEDATRPRARHSLHRIAWRSFPATEMATLEYFMADYVGHLKHHLGQIATPA